MAQSRLDQIRQMRSSGASADAVAEALQSPTIGQLRNRLAAASQQAMALSAQLRASHPRMKAANAEVADIRRQINGELSRVSRSAELELQRAQSAENQLQAEIRSLTSTTLEKNSHLVKLRQLEREALAARQVYQTFLVRAREISEQQTVDTSLTRVISPAVSPAGRSGATLPVLLAGALTIGLGLGALLALIREYADRTVRNPKRLVRATEVPLLSVVPGMVDLGIIGGGSRKSVASAGPIPDHMPNVIGDDTNSPQARSFARLRNQIQQLNPNAKGARKILVTAAGAEQGKSTVALNIALSAAMENERVVLIDGDPTRRYMSRILMPGAPAGLSELSAGAVPLNETLFKDEDNGITFMAAQAGERRFSQRLTLSGLGKALLGVEDGHDLIVIDGGVPGVDASLHMLADLVDDIVIVTREGITDLDDLTRATNALSSRKDKVRGTVLLAS